MTKGAVYAYVYPPRAKIPLKLEGPTLDEGNVETSTIDFLLGPYDRFGRVFSCFLLKVKGTHSVLRSKILLFLTDFIDSVRAK